MRYTGLFRYRPMSKWSVKRAVQRTKCRVGDAQAALFDIASTWADVDQGIVNEADEWVRSLEQWKADVEEAIAERQAAGEEFAR